MGGWRWSPGAGLNCRPLPYQGSALPLSYPGLHRRRGPVRPARRPGRYGGMAPEPWAAPGVSIMGRGGFEPPKASPSDLQSDPFGRSGISPLNDFSQLREVGGSPERHDGINRLELFRPFAPGLGAGDGTRTRNLRITNAPLCQLSYASVLNLYFIRNSGGRCQFPFLRHPARCPCGPRPVGISAGHPRVACSRGIAAARRSPPEGTRPALRNPFDGLRKAASLGGRSRPPPAPAQRRESPTSQGRAGSARSRRRTHSR